MTTKIYRYVVKTDQGSAPNPCDGYCTLAICKPGIRKTAGKGDWIIGFRSGSDDQVIYVMKVSETMTFTDYWHDQRFETRKPLLSPLSDNIYRPDGKGKVKQVDNQVHPNKPKTIERDLSGINVLVSKKFWYFGESSPRFDRDLTHLIHKGIGHSVHTNRQESDVSRLKEWLSLHGATGVHGNPVDLREGVGFSFKKGRASVLSPQNKNDPRLSQSKCSGTC